MGAILAKYGQALTIEFPMVKAGVVDLAATADWTPATGDTKVSKDGGAVANTTNNPAVVSGGVLWSLTLTATEMQAARVSVQIVDSATKAVEDQAILIHTYGNASALHAVDLDDSVRAGLTALPNAAADAAGGLPISDLGGLDMDAILVDTNALNDTKVPDTISLANINAEVDTALGTTTYAEPGQGTPAATATLAAKIGYLYKAWRNRTTQTASQYSLYNDDTTTIDQKATFSDDATTADRGEIATGP